jgi:hypothetical protein
MGEVEITYEITRKDYAEANAVIIRKSQHSRVSTWMILGSAILLLVLPLGCKDLGKDWRYPLLTVPFAAYMLYQFLLSVSPFLNGIISYRGINLDGKKFVARFSPQEVKISRTHLTWIHQWPSFQWIHESQTLFIFYDGTVMYIFAKRYFNAPQIETVRQLVSEHRETASGA